MPQAEVIMSRILDITWQRSDSSVRERKGRATTAADVDVAPCAATADDARSAQAIVVKSDEQITPFPWSTRAVDIIEEVQLPGELDPRLTLLRASESPAARAYRLLQHRLASKGDPRVIVVTSAEPGAGKTTCAANLALALSERALSRVLLVDANLLRPGIADLFGYEPAHSFMIQLLRSEDASLPHAVASIGGLALQLAALLPGFTRGKRLDPALFAEAIAALRVSYDYIVVDAACVLESADVNDASRCADGVVLVARAGESRADRLGKAIRQLAPAEVLGTVLLDT